MEAYIGALNAAQAAEQNARTLQTKQEVAMFEQQKGSRKEEADRYWQSADIQRQFSNRDLAQLMEAQGRTGGLSESSALRNRLAYENTSNSIRSNLNKALKELDSSIANAQATGNAALAEIAGKYAMAIAQAQLQMASGAGGGGNYYRSKGSKTKSSVTPNYGYWQKPDYTSTQWSKPSGYTATQWSTPSR